MGLARACLSVVGCVPGAGSGGGGCGGVGTSGGRLGSRLATEWSRRVFVGSVILILRRMGVRNRLITVVCNDN